MVPPPLWMDAVKAPLNPCSLETIPEPVELANGQWVWPMMLSCYELLQPQQQELGQQEQQPPPSSPVSLAGAGATGAQPQQSPQQEQQRKRRQKQRVGRMDLYMVPVPDIANSNAPSLPLHFGKPHTILNEEDEHSSGILDGKWLCLERDNNNHSNTNNHSNNQQYHPYHHGRRCRKNKSTWCFASAHATGDIQLHSLSIRSRNSDDDDEEEEENDDDDNYHKKPLFSTKFMGESSSRSMVSSNSSTSGSGSPVASPTTVPLCLSLTWNAPDATTALFSSLQQQPQEPLQILSTYSNGRIALHDVIFSAYNSSNNNNHHHCSNNDDDDEEEQRLESMAQLILRDSWMGHSMFTSPAEVWSACFCRTTTTTTGPEYNLLLSCGDEGTLKFWDVRSTARPVQVYKNHFDAGITCASHHPRQDYLVACGSYDETLALYDIRYIPTRTANHSYHNHHSNNNHMLSDDNNSMFRIATPSLSFGSSSSTCRSTTTTTTKEGSFAYDYRSPRLCRTKPLGGGIWRIKWHPYLDHRLLVAAMHGGCRVLHVRGMELLLDDTANEQQQQQHQEHFEAPTPLPLLSSSLPSAAPAALVRNSSSNSSTSIQDGSHTAAAAAAAVLSCKSVKKFVEHESMAYGADWFVCRHPTQNGYFEAAASCSFYDRAVYLWDSIF